MTSSPSADSPSASAAAPSPPRVPAWLGNRWVQGTAGGVLALVPVRRYPEWLRQAIMWVPATAATTVVVTPRVWEKLADAARESPAQQEHEQEPVEPELLATEQSREHHRPPLTPGRRAALWGVGLTVGASVYGYMRFSLWVDGAIEDKLREHGVARPRVVMAVLGGLATGLTGGAPPRQRPRADTA
ncbi:hypothetical protein [Nesterenkonia sandarakina]|uniref:Uncharacterized protein n=1 Tax=Nesterenkonia sandarakina TaxID=272918 RepID=A0A2T0YS71_9MICC|nr:hypothetical protein [Nesterenkonia sandarakina]PRZ18520.1 hypothetical protein BCL67_102185 [Nesterenkonia sandarakina]